MRFAYNTNGCSNHRLEDAIELLADHGYDGVALTLDHHHLDPMRDGWEARADELAERLQRLDLGVVIETGARFLLDPTKKHRPTLLDARVDGRALRVEFLHRAHAIAERLGAEALSFWAGTTPSDCDEATAWDRLCDGISNLLERTPDDCSVPLCVEPEPGMLVETIDDLDRLRTRLGVDSNTLRLALDTGHCLVTGDRDPDVAVRERQAELGTVSIEDMRRGEHVHLPFGRGDMDLPRVLGALKEVGYERLVCVELSRESHRADRAIPEAIEALKRALADC